MTEEIQKKYEEPVGEPQEETSQIDLDELRRQFDTEARFRQLAGWAGKLVLLIAVGLSLFHLYTAGFGLLNALK